MQIYLKIREFIELIFGERVVLENTVYYLEERETSCGWTANNFKPTYFSLVNEGSDSNRDTAADHKDGSLDA
jgi:hypothetical protein